MAKIDEIYKDLVNTIIDEGEMESGDVRPKYADGTPAYTKRIYGVNFKIKPEDGLPILQSKKVAMKSFKAEIDWIWRLMSNDINVLNDMGSKVWDEWGVPRRKNELIWVDKKEYKGNTNLDGLNKVRVRDNVTEYIGKYESNNFGPYYLLEDNKEENKITVQFCNTGHIKTVSRAALFTKGISDPYFRTYSGIGYLGDNQADDIMKAFGPFYRRWMTTWQSMITRCKEEPSIEERNIKYYKDVSVSEEFQSCENFLRWVYQNNPYGQKELGVLQLDKDYYGSRIYSPETCVLLMPSENKALARKKWIYEDGKLYYSVLEFARELEKRYPNKKWITDITFKPNTFAKNYIDNLEKEGKIEYINPYDEVDNKLPRFSLETSLDIGKSYGWQLKNKKYSILDYTYIDEDGLKQPVYKKLNQVEYIIHEIINNPSSRRIMTNLYDVDDLDEMALFPCVFMTSWQVRENNQLDLIVTQRSADVALGLPSNLFEYSLLHHRIAQVTGREVGTLHWNIFNAHIYDRHIDLLQEQVNADISHLEDTHAKFILPEDKDYFNVSLRDVEVVDYVHNGSYKYEIAI